MEIYFFIAQFFCLFFTIYGKFVEIADEICQPSCFNNLTAAIRHKNKCKIILKNPWKLLHNWGGNFMFSTQNIQYPRTTAQAQQIVTRATRLRAMGSRHSFSKIGDTCDTILATLGMNAMVGINTTTATVTVQAGITYTDLAPILYVNNYALPNLAALGQITVAGAIQNGVHGSGLDHGCLASQVHSVQMVLANGSVANFGAKSFEFNAVTSGLGAFGVVTQVKLNLIPSFDVINYVFTEMTEKNLYKNFDELQRMGYTVNLINSLQNVSSWSTILITVIANSAQDKNLKNLTSLYGAKRLYGSTLISPFFIEINKVQPWYNGLLVYRVGMSGNDGNELQSEYFVPYKHGLAAIKAISPLYPQIQPLVGIGLVIRTVKADNFWMSMNYGNGTRLAIHFSWVNNVSLVNPVLEQIEEKLLQFDARPHWAKYYLMKPRKFLHTYPRLNEFKNLAERLDPGHKFRNKFLNENIFAQS